jgi:hypothetical protein
MPVSIPYTVPVEGVVFIGVLYINDPLEDSYTEGKFVGVVNGTYRIDKNNPEVCEVGPLGLQKACIKIDFAHRKLFGKFCVHQLGGGWLCGEWVELVSW